jgi:hypothetical protein
MSSLQSIRQRQIAEVIDADRNISKRVFDTQFNTVKQFQDVYKQPSPLEKKVSYEIEKFIIEMESILIDIQNELEQKIAPLEGKLLEQVGEPDIEEKEKENKEREEEDVDEPVAPVVIGKNDDDDDDDEEPIRGRGRKRLKGGVKEVKFSLLEVWNKFVNYVSKLANLQQFNQNDLNVLYDRLDDLIPILQTIQSLNRDALKLNINPIGEGTIDALLNKIQSRSITPIAPTRDLPQFSSSYAKNLQDQLKREEEIMALIISEVDYQNQKKKFNNRLDSAQKNLRRNLEKKEDREREDKKPSPQNIFAIKDNQAEIEVAKQELNNLEKRKEFTLQLGGEEAGYTPIQVKQRIDKLKKELSGRRNVAEVVKASRQPTRPALLPSRQAVRGEGKTATSNILKNYGDAVYKIYESIPSLSYDELENLYVDLNDRRKMSAESNDPAGWEKFNFLVNAILADDRANDIQKILGNGRTVMNDYKYGKTGNALPFRDGGNEMYSY